MFANMGIERFLCPKTEYKSSNNYRTHIKSNHISNHIIFSEARFLNTNWLHTEKKLVDEENPSLIFSFHD